MYKAESIQNKNSKTFQKVNLIFYRIYKAYQISKPAFDKKYHYLIKHYKLQFFHMFLSF